MILVSQNDPTRTRMRRRQYSTPKIYFLELFLAAKFSQKYKKPSEKVPTEHFLICDTIISQPSNMYILYIIYVILYSKKNVL